MPVKKYATHSTASHRSDRVRPSICSRLRLEASQDYEGLFEGWAGGPPHMSVPTGSGQEFRIGEVRVQLQPKPRPLTKRALRVGVGGIERLEKPTRTRRDETFERSQPGPERITTINHLAHIVHERRREQFLVKWPLRMHVLKRLQGMLEPVAFWIQRGILPHAGQRPEQIGDAIKPVTDEVAESTTDIVMRGQLMLGHPASCDPPCGPQA